MCAASLWVGVSSAESVSHEQEPRWDRQALWESATKASAGSHRDADQDGIPDDAELALARAYFPYYSIDSRDDCARHGVLFRLSPHPDDPEKIAIWYVVLYEQDCGRLGLGAHLGDDEGVSAVIDPKIAPPEGILALRAISHQNTVLERETNCGSLPGLGACRTADVGGKPFPVVFASANKHGQYVSQLSCNTWPNDLGACSLSRAPDEPPMVNAGEPGHALSKDLTTAGFITTDNGWSEASLLHFDPWSGRKFGRAGNLTEDLVDPAFLIRVPAR